MIIPTVPCEIERLGASDLYGQHKLGPAKSAYCAVVRLSRASEKTSVRTDSSASGGAAREYILSARLLFEPQVSLKEGDRVTVAGKVLKVEEIQDRYDMQGALDHCQVDLSAWA